MRLVWTTDIHLNHVPDATRQRWLQAVAAQGCEGIVISGDIAESGDVVSYLQEIARSVAVPIFFVLGNHDFYGSSIGATGQEVIRACRESDRLHYLTDMSAISLSDRGRQRRIYLVGDDGWGDATEGDYEHSYVRLNDFAQIEDFRQSDSSSWKAMLEHLGAVSAERLSAKLRAIPVEASDVLIVTHVPPFRDACWYEGHTTDDNWAPFFVCGQLGRAIRRVSQSRPDCRYTVLCGHTHHHGVARMDRNLTVYTAAACYGKPEIVAIVNVTDDSVTMEPPQAST